MAQAVRHDVQMMRVLWVPARQGGIMFKPGDKVQVIITLGDRNPDGQIDVTVEGFAAIPLIDKEPRALVSHTFDIPVDKLVALVAGLTPAAAHGVLMLLAAAGVKVPDWANSARPNSG